MSAILGRCIQPQLERGPAASPKLRILMALVGGILAGFASRLASGCTSGQAPTGGNDAVNGIGRRTEVSPLDGDHIDHLKPSGDVGKFV